MADRQEQAEKDYLAGMKYKEIAEKYEVSINTVKSWKQRNGWSRDGTKKGAHKKQKGAPVNNQYAKGNKGGPPPDNKNAVTHGLFAKWLPQETQDIMETIQLRSEADMLWDSIMFQYTAILRSQKIMFVTDINDMSKENIGSSWGEGGGSESFTVQFAWDKQVSFLSAQSRALGTLSNLIKQFVSMTDEADERRQKLSLLQHQIDKTKAEAEKISKDQGDDAEEIIIVDEWGDNDA